VGAVVPPNSGSRTAGLPRLAVIFGWKDYVFHFSLLHGQRSGQGAPRVRSVSKASASNFCARPSLILAKIANRRSSDEAGVMLVERRGQVIAVGSEPTGNRADSAICSDKPVALPPGRGEARRGLITRHFRVVASAVSLPGALWRLVVDACRHPTGGRPRLAWARAGTLCRRSW
jgi:hypothetical protein